MVSSFIYVTLQAHTETTCGKIYYVGKKWVMWPHSLTRQNISIVIWFPWCPKSIPESENRVRLNSSLRLFFPISRISSRAFQIDTQLVKKQRFSEPNHFSSLTGVSCHNNVLSDFVLTKIQESSSFAKIFPLQRKHGWDYWVTLLQWAWSTRSTSQLPLAQQSFTGEVSTSYTLPWLVRVARSLRVCGDILRDPNRELGLELVVSSFFNSTKRQKSQLSLLTYLKGTL